MPTVWIIVCTQVSKSEVNSVYFPCRVDLKRFLKKKCKDELGVVDVKLGSLIKEELGIQV